MPSAGDNHGRSGLGFLLGVTHRERRRAWESQLADLHITAPQAALPRLVSGHPGRGIRLLARKLATDLMNVQRLADSLAHRQLLETRVDPADARRRPLYPPPPASYSPSSSPTAPSAPRSTSPTSSEATPTRCSSTG